MQVKQYSVKVFEVTIENEEEFLAFARKNSLLLKRYLLLLKGDITPTIENFLGDEGIAFTHNLSLQAPNSTSFQHFTKQSGLRIIDQLVRSGQEIIEKRDLLVLKRVNSGATIHTDGNFIALSSIDGHIECNGDFMLLKPSSKASIIFNGVDISEAMDEEIFYKIRLENNEILISKYAKDIQWA
jgi:septum site-determining protein MinC